MRRSIVSRGIVSHARRTKKGDTAFGKMTACIIHFIYRFGGMVAQLALTQLTLVRIQQAVPSICGCRSMDRTWVYETQNESSILSNRTRGLIDASGEHPSNQHQPKRCMALAWISSPRPKQCFENRNGMGFKSPRLHHQDKSYNILKI